MEDSVGLLVQLEGGSVPTHTRAAAFTYPYLDTLGGEFRYMTLWSQDETGSQYQVTLGPPREETRAIVVLLDVAPPIQKYAPPEVRRVAFSAPINLLALSTTKNGQAEPVAVFLASKEAQDAAGAEIRMQAAVYGPPHKQEAPLDQRQFPQPLRDLRALSSATTSTNAATHVEAAAMFAAVAVGGMTDGVNQQLLVTQFVRGFDRDNALPIVELPAAARIHTETPASLKHLFDTGVVAGLYEDGLLANQPDMTPLLVRAGKYLTSAANMMHYSPDEAVIGGAVPFMIENMETSLPQYIGAGDCEDLSVVIARTYAALIGVAFGPTAGSHGQLFQPLKEMAQVIGPTQYVLAFAVCGVAAARVPDEPAAVAMVTGGHMLCLLLPKEQFTGEPIPDSKPVLVLEGTNFVECMHRQQDGYRTEIAQTKRDIQAALSSEEDPVPSPQSYILFSEDTPLKFYQSLVWIMTIPTTAAPPEVYLARDPTTGLIGMSFMDVWKKAAVPLWLKVDYAATVPSEVTLDKLHIDVRRLQETPRVLQQDPTKDAATLTMNDLPDTCGWFWNALLHNYALHWLRPWRGFNLGRAGPGKLPGQSEHQKSDGAPKSAREWVNLTTPRRRKTDAGAQDGAQGRANRALKTSMYRVFLKVAALDAALKQKLQQLHDASWHTIMYKTRHQTTDEWARQKFRQYTVTYTTWHYSSTAILVSIHCINIARLEEALVAHEPDIVSMTVVADDGQYV